MAMKILIIDRDPLATQLLQSRLQNDGHEVMTEPVRKVALEMLAQDKFDVILIDPAPLPSVRQVTLPLRWEQTSHYFYIIQVSHAIEADEVTQAGLNDTIAKPFDWQDVQAKMANAQRLTGLMHHLQESAEIHSDGVIFGKRAFYQLVLSALDRAYRYDERAFLMHIGVSNWSGLQARLDQTRLKELHQKIERFLSSLHRRSDFLGHLDVAEYSLLILRPAVSSEPLDAVDRFGIALRDFQQELGQQGFGSAEQPHFNLQLWSLPSAEIIRDYRLEG